MTPDPSTANRLALGLMAARRIPYAEAVRQLGQLTLHIVCGREVIGSAPRQAALLTAVNAGLRAFLGGVRVELFPNVPLAVPWPRQTTLNGAVEDLLSGRGLSGDVDASHVIYIGSSQTKAKRHALVVDASGWRGGVTPASHASRFDSGGDTDFALGGVLAGALAVHRGFLRATALAPFACDEPVGLSLWNLSREWEAARNEGPRLLALPDGLWLLGLGHLGQAFAWTLGLLPFGDPSRCEVLLQDYDRVEDANLGAGLLCSRPFVGQRKTRVCAQWLEARGFRTKLCERRFDQSTQRMPDEPAIALCGFDKAEPRRLLENAGFSQVIECGLGASSQDFDRMHVHNFPGRRRADQIWSSANRATGPNQNLVEALAGGGEECGALAIEVASKSVSTSFVGAMASTIVFSELLRAFHKGPRSDEIYLAPRNMMDSDFVRSDFQYSASRIAEVGFTEARAPVLHEGAEATGRRAAEDVRQSGSANTLSEELQIVEK